MKKFIATIASVITLFSVAAHAAAVQDCRHDVAPVEIGRYAADQKNNVVVSEEVIPVGSTVTMSYRVGDDMIGWVTCRTTKVRKHATVKGGEVYDIGCGNVVRKVEKAGVVRKEEPATNLDIQRPVCDGKCQLEKVCATDNGTLVATEVGLVCKLPKLTMTFEQEVETSGKVTWTDKGWTGEKHTVPGPKLDVAIGKTEVNISKEMCYTQGCAWKQQATFRSEVKAKICGIVVGNVGPKDRLLWLATDEKSGNLQITELLDEDMNADGTVNKTTLGTKLANKTVKSMLTNRKVSASCDTDQEFVEKQVWHHVVKYFNFPNACIIAGRTQGPRK